MGAGSVKVGGEVEPKSGGPPDELLVLQQKGALELDEEPGRIGSWRIERANVPVAAGHEQLRAPQVPYEICRVVCRPNVTLRDRVAEERERVVPERREKKPAAPRSHTARGRAGRRWDGGC